MRFIRPEQPLETPLFADAAVGRLVLGSICDQDFNRYRSKGRWIDNVFTERLWRSVNYEDVYLRAYENGREVQAGLARYFDFYNRRRIHQSHDYRTPDEIYFGTAVTEPLAMAA